MNNDGRTLDTLDIDDGLDQDYNITNDDFNPDTYVKPYLGANGEPEPDIQDTTPEDKNIEDEDDLITAYLKSKGVNGSMIKIESEDGVVEEKDFNSLSRQEQLDILNSFTNESEDSPELDDSEIDLLNTIRENDLSVEDYLDWIKRQAIEDYIRQVNEEYNRIDTLTDDEVFLLDIKSMAPDITDEEALEALEHEKTSSLWDKKIAGLRQRYKDLEAADMEANQLAAREEAEQQALESQNNIKEAINSFDSIGEFDLEDDDKEEIAEFIFGVDATGTRYLARALNDPAILAKMAWFALKGEEALDSLSSYYKNQIEQYSKDNYKKGFEDGKNGKQTKQVSTPKSTVIKNNNKSNKNGNERENPEFIPLMDTSRYMIDLD